MPLCFIYTNLPESSFPAEFEEEFSKCVAEVLNKPIERITVMINAGIRMTFAGKHQQGIVCQIHGIKVFDEEKNPGYFLPLNTCITKMTKIEPSRVAIEFVDLQAHMVKTGP